MNVRRRRTGVVLCGQIDGDVEGWRLQWERAPDAAGSPDTGAAEVVDVLDPRERQLVDTSAGLFTGAPSYWYRYRTVRGPCATPGPWSGWIHATPDVFPDTLPGCPAPAVGPPTVSLEQTAREPLTETWQATGTPHPESEAGAGGLELRYRTRIEGRGWSPWEPTGADGWTVTNPLAISVLRKLHQRQTVQVEARDTSLRGSPVGERKTVAIKSLMEIIDLPGLGRGPLEDDLGRGGVGGEIPGGQRVKAPVYSRDGADPIVDTDARELHNLTLLSSNLLDAGVQGSPGQDVLGFINKATEPGSTPHAGVHVFERTFQAAPKVDVLAGWKSIDAGLSGGQRPDVRPVNVSPAAFEVYARITQEVAGTTAETAAFSSDTIDPAVGIDGRDYSAEQGGAPPAWDDRYTYVLDLEAFATQGPPPNEICLPGSITIGFYTNDGAGFTLRETTSISAQCAGRAEADREVRVAVSGDLNHGGKEFATGVEREFGLGGTYTAKRVDWTSATAPGSVDATGGGAYPVSWVAYVKEDA